jgi:hypothetical protein
MPLVVGIPTIRDMSVLDGGRRHDTVLMNCHLVDYIMPR